MADLTASQLTAFLPRLRNVDVWIAALNPAMTRFEINSPARVAAFLAQAAHESTEFGGLVENLNYSAVGLTKTFERFFPTLDAAQPYARQPEKIANYVYAKRLGNGDTASGDGWRYRGRGILQITGRGTYRECGAVLALPLEAEPELLATPNAAALAAAQYWQSHGLNPLADDENDDNDEADFVRITKLINGGTNGLKERRDYWARAKAALA